MLVENLTDALLYLASFHEGCIVHRNLNPHNIFISDECKPDVQTKALTRMEAGQAGEPGCFHDDETWVRCKIGDFGTAKRLNNISETMDSEQGNACYWAPEQLRMSTLISGSVKYDRSVDWWSLGVILYQACFGVFPFVDDGEFVWHMSPPNLLNSITKNPPALRFPKPNVSINRCPEIVEVIKHMVNGTNGLLAIEPSMRLTGGFWESGGAAASGAGKP
jgi:serine/threonine protein kinase